MITATITIGSAGYPPPGELCRTPFRAALATTGFGPLRSLDVVVVVAADAPPGALVPDPGRVVVVATVAGVVPPPTTVVRDGEGPGPGDGVGLVVVLVGDGFDWPGDEPPPPPPLPVPPPDDATGATPGQAWAKAAAGVTDGFVALAVAGPGFWNRQPST
jgi:hypothetical protein